MKNNSTLLENHFLHIPGICPPMSTAAPYQVGINQTASGTKGIDICMLMFKLIRKQRTDQSLLFPTLISLLASEKSRSTTKQKI